MTDERTLRLAVVGPCAAGKSTLVAALRDAGYVARQPAQEHSYVPHMWRQMARPDLLIFLDVDFPAYQQRRPRGGGGPGWLQAQQERLAHARAHCDFYLDTSNLSAAEVRAAVFAYLDDVAPAA